MGRDERPPAVAYAYLALAIFLWGAGYWPTEVAGEHSSPLMVSALRSLPAALPLLAFVLILRGRLPRGRTLVSACITGLLMVGVFFFCLTEATLRAGPGNAAVLANTSPFIVLLLGLTLASERITRVGLAGLIVGFAGVVVTVSTQLGGGGSEVASGLAFAAAAAVAWAVGTLLVKLAAQREPDLDLAGYTAVQYAAGGAGLTAIALAFSGPGEVSWGSGALWAALVFLVLGNSALASIAYFATLKRLTATRAAAGQFLVPAVAVLVDIVRGSAPEGVVLVGMALTVLGVALVNAPPRRPRASQAAVGRIPAAEPVPASARED